MIQCSTVNDIVLAASWSELGRINIWNLTQQLQAVDDEHILKRYTKENKANSIKPVFTFTGHQSEGYAVDWSSVKPGVSHNCST